MKLLLTRIQPLTTVGVQSIFRLVASMVVLATPAMAAELRGVVIGSDGLSVSGATVKLSTSLMMSLTSLTPTTLAETTTDNDGQFHVEVPDVWYETPAPWRQELALTVATEDHGNGGILVHRDLPLPRHRLTIQLEQWSERAISLRSADDKPLAGVRVKLTGWLLPIIYPARYSQFAKRQIAPIDFGMLQSSGTSDDSGSVTMFLPPIESMAAVEAEIEKNVFVNWSVVSNDATVPKDWSEKLKVPEHRRLPIEVTFKDSDASDLQLTVNSMPRVSLGATTRIRHAVELTADGKSSAVIQNESILLLRNSSETSPDIYLSPEWQDNSTTVEQLSVTFGKGVKVTGRAVSEKGEPAAGIRLTLMINWTTLPVSSDADGRFEFFAPAGQILLVPLARSGYRLEKMGPDAAIVIPESKDTHDFGDVVFTRLKSLNGIVLDESGRTVPGATVEASWNEPHLYQPQVMETRDEQLTTNGVGEFSISDIDPEAEVTLVAYHGESTAERIVSINSQQLDDPITVTISPAAAITVSGRVVDQSGSGIGGQPVTIRHRMKPPITDAQLPLGEDIEDLRLVTDEDGQYATPKSLLPFGEYIAVIRAGTKREAHSGWNVAYPGQPLELPLIEDSRTTEISGRTTTADGNPLPQARIVVLASGGQATAISSENGTFTIERPAGRMPLLIAEADGYLASGTSITELASALEIRLPRADQLPLESQTFATNESLPERWTVEQRQQLAIKLLEAGRFSNQQILARVKATIARSMPEYILGKLDSLPPVNEMTGQMVRSALAVGLAQDRPEEGLRLLDEFPDGTMKLYMLIQFELAAKLEEADRLQLLARIVQDGRGIKEAEHRVVGIAQVGERLLNLGQLESGEALLREGLEDAKKLSPAGWSAYARGTFAEELAQVDADAALALIEPITDTFEYNRHIQNVAHELATIDPDRAIALLDKFRDPDPSRRPIAGERNLAALRVCYRLILVAPDKAMMLGRSIDHASLKAYSFSLMAESLLRHDKVSDANRRLARQLHDDAWQMLADDFKNKDQSDVAWMYPSTIAALLLQRTAELAPEQLPHRIWQAIALRRPMEKSGSYQMAGEGCACELALVLAEVDRDRAEQVASWLPSPTSGTTQFMSFVDYSRPAAELLAELHPDQCEATLDAIKDPASNERLRTALISALVRTGDTRHRAIRQNLLLWFPDDEDMGPVD